MSRLGRMAVALLLLLCLMTETGCWSRKELNELAIVAALGVDAHQKGYEVTAQVLNSSDLSQQRSPGKLSVITYRGTGATIPDALQRILSAAPRQLYLSHLRILVFGEDLARQGLSGVLDYFSRNHEIRTDFYLLAARQSKAADVMRVLTPFEPIPANSLFSSIHVAHRKWAATGSITLQQFITELERKGANPILPGVRIIGSKEKGRSTRNLDDIDPDTLLIHAGLAVFKDDKLVGWLEESKSKTVNYVLNEVNTTVAHIVCPGSEKETLGVEINEARSKTEARLDENGRPVFKVMIKVEANIDSVGCSIDLSSMDTVKVIEDLLENKIDAAIANNIRFIQKKYGTDVFGFGEALHRKYPKVWSNYRQQWHDIFRTAVIEVESDAIIRRIGSIVQPVKREMQQQ